MPSTNNVYVEDWRDQDTVGDALLTTQKQGDGSHALVVVPGTSAAPGVVRIEDGVTSNLVTVQAFHNADNQVLLGTAFGLLTGGVAQLINAIGNLDRQKETSVDGVPALGIATGTQQNAMAFATTHAGSTVIGAATVFTPAAMSGTINGAAWSIQVGSALSIDTGANQETIIVASVTSTTFTAKTTKNHTGSFAVNGFVYNQQRDGTAPDGQVLGIAAGATYLWNSQSNSGNGGWERERSASGELDAASGAGTAVAAEYEFNGVAFDRARNIQGKGKTASAITATSGGDANLTFSADPSLAANGGLKAGQYIILSTGNPSPLAGDLVVVGSAYVSGTTVPVTPAGLTTSITAGRTQANFSSFALLGPGLNGFIIDGIGLEEEALYDPVTGLYFIERAATQDAASGQNIVLEALALFNGSTFDRMRTPNVFKPFTISASNAETTVWTPAAGKKFRLMGYALFSDTGTVLTFRDNTAGTTIIKDGVAANNRSVSAPMGNGILSATINNLLTLQATTAATINGVVFGTEE